MGRYEPRQIFVKPEDVSELEGFLGEVLELGNQRMKEAAASLLGELRTVRSDIDYSPLSGKQVLLQEDEARLYEIYEESLKEA